MDGVQLYWLLLNKYHLQLEMYTAHYVLAMTSIMDTQDGFERLAGALLHIDQELEKNEEQPVDGEQPEIKSAIKSVCAENFLAKAYTKREKVMEISKASYYNIEETLLSESIGKVCAEYIYLYPPGIPMIVPGEMISKGLIEVMDECRRAGLHIQGMKDNQLQKIVTVK